MLLILAAAAGVIWLQIFLSKKERKWAGLMLPIISFGISVIVLMGNLFFSAVTGTATLMEDGKIIEQTTTQLAQAPAVMGAAFYVFLLFNIPTGVLLAIYASCQGKHKRRHDLDKMTVQDIA
jgi:hypothetical protein